MSPAKDHQLTLILLANDFKNALAKAFVKEAKLRRQQTQLTNKLARVSEKLKQKTDVRDVFESKTFSPLSQATKEAFLEQVANESPKALRKTGSTRLGKDEKLKLLRKAIGNRSEMKLAELKDILDVTNVNQWLSGLGLPKGSIESLGSKKAGSRLLVDKIKHLLGS